MKEKTLKEIEEKLTNFSKSPLYQLRIKEGNLPVMGEGSVLSVVMFIGEAPGKNEARKGKPFCGKAGDVLNKYLDQISIKRNDVYITNIVKDRPPQNRDPEEEEIRAYAPFLNKEIEVINPKIIVTLGRFSTHYILRKYNQEDKIKPISIMEGKPVTIQKKEGTFYILPLFHPAAVIYDKQKEEKLKEGFLVLKKLINIINGK